MSVILREELSYRQTDRQADKQTDKQTNTRQNIISSAEVITVSPDHLRL